VQETLAKEKKIYVAQTNACNSFLYFMGIYPLHNVWHKKAQTQKILIRTAQENHRNNYEDMLIIMASHLANQTTRNDMNCEASATLNLVQHLSQQMHSV